MFRTPTLMAFLLVAMVAGLVLAGPGAAWAQNSTDVFWVAYYSGGATTQGGTGIGTVQVVNPGVSGGTLCADIYVFDPRQELKECCHCRITPDALLTLPVGFLTNNPANGLFGTNGVIKIVRIKLRDVHHHETTKRQVDSKTQKKLDATYLKKAA